MKIGNTTFNPEAVKKMGFPAFKKTYKGLLRGDLMAIYAQITGEKVKTEKQPEPEKGTE